MSSDRSSMHLYIDYCAPVRFIDWWFKSEGKPGRDCLHHALFTPDDAGRDLTSPEVRAAVLACIEQHSDLRELVVETIAEELVAEPAPPDPEEEAERKIRRALSDKALSRLGLVPGGRIRLERALPIFDHAGKQVRVHNSGEVWTILGVDPDGTVWLEQPDKERHTWTADDLFDTFERV